MNWLSWDGYRDLWGRVVFRYAGRNLACHNVRRSRNFYNVIGWVYDSVYTRPIINYRKVSYYVAERFVKEGDKVLELGCGTGLFMHQISHKAKLVLGLDISLGMLHKAQRRISPHSHVELVNADCRYLPVNGTFNKIFTAFMLVILSRRERQAVIRNLNPLLDKNGEILFLESREEFSCEWLSREEWITYCENAGFSDVFVEDIFDYYRIVRARKNV